MKTSQSIVGRVEGKYGCAKLFKEYYVDGEDTKGSNIVDLSARHSFNVPQHRMADFMTIVDELRKNESHMTLYEKQYGSGGMVLMFDKSARFSYGSICDIVMVVVGMLFGRKSIVAVSTRVDTSTRVEGMSGLMLHIPDIVVDVEYRKEFITKFNDQLGQLGSANHLEHKVDSSSAIVPVPFIYVNDCEKPSNNRNLAYIFDADGKLSDVVNTYTGVNLIRRCSIRSNGIDNIYTSYASKCREYPTAPAVTEYKKVQPPVYSTHRMYSIYADMRCKRENYMAMRADELLSYIVDNGKGHEGIYGKCKPYFDFDYSYDSKQEQVSSEYDVVVSCAEAVMDFCGCGIENLRILTSSGHSITKRKWVNSVHIIVNGKMTYDSGSELRNDLIDYDITPAPDYAVYSGYGKRQLFRLPYCSKEGENRPFVYTTISSGGLVKLSKYEFIKEFGCRIDECMVSAENISVNECAGSSSLPETKDIGEYQKYVDLFTEAFPLVAECHMVRCAKDFGECIIINFDRLCPSFCDVCQRQHGATSTGVGGNGKGDNTLFLMVMADGAVKYGCTHKEGSDKKYIDVVAGKKLTPEERIVKIVAVANKKFKQIEQGNVAQIVNEGFTVREYNTPHCLDIAELAEDIKGLNESDQRCVIGVKANMGSGKSFMMSDIVKGYTRPMRICIISNRISLASKYKEDYPGFECYLDNRKTELVSDRIIVQMDSLYRIKWTANPYNGRAFCDLLVLDEADQTMRHMASSTYLKNDHVMTNNAIFDRLVKDATSIVCMSANLDWWTMGQVNKIRETNNDRRVFYINRFNPIKNTIQLTMNKADIFIAIAIDLKENKRVYLASNTSVEYIESMSAKLKAKNPDKKVLTICRKTLKDQNVIDAMANPNEEWGKYDVVICSPSVQGGVSYDVRDSFDKVYGMFLNLSNSSSDACQMLRRVRYPKSNDIMVSVTYHNTLCDIVSRDEYIDHIYANRRFEELDRMQRSYHFSINSSGRAEFNRSQFFKMYVDIKICAIRDRQNWCFNFVCNQLGYDSVVEIAKFAQTYTIVRGEGIVNVDRTECQTIVKNALKQQRTDNRNDHGVKLSEAKDITHDMYEDIKKRSKTDPQRVTPNEDLEYEKYELRKLYGVVGERSPTWYAKYSDSKVRKEYSVVRVYYISDNFDDNLRDIKDRENDREAHVRSYDVGGSEAGTRDEVNDETAIVKSLPLKYDYAKNEILIGWLKVVGFAKHNDDTKVSRADLVDGLTTIYNTADTGRIATVFGKRKDRCKFKEKPTSDKFVKTMLDFVNGMLKSTMYLSIVSCDYKRSHYRLSNSVDSLFAVVASYTPPDGGGGIDSMPFLRGRPDSVNVGLV
jgi:hypothetical protein